MIKLFLISLLCIQVNNHSKPPAIVTDLGISGWYTGYLKLYDSSQQHYERYNIQIKIYQKENIILASALDMAMAGRCYAISELRGYISNNKLHLKAQFFRKKKTDDFIDFVLSDYTFPLNMKNKFWYGKVFSFYENRQYAIGGIKDEIFLERKTNNMTLDDLYNYKLPIIINDKHKNDDLGQQYERKIKALDELFLLKQRKTTK